MERIIECVPNFSEGRDRKIIDAIGASVQKVAGITLLSIEPDKDYNRTVVTFIGGPDAVAEAAFQATKTASDLIDMTLQKGEHPRIGASDVVPFVPIRGVTMDECAALSKRYGERVAQELRIPVYLYEYAASSPERKNLSSIRKGEYEELPAKLSDPVWKPDFGEAVFHPKSGATVTGARKVLIAYNVNLNTDDQKLAHEISLRIRESGRFLKDRYGKQVTNDRGEAIKIPGTLKCVKAMGVLLERFGIAQVSINLVDYEVTSMHDVFEEVKKQAHVLDIEATGSELVGLAPLEAFLRAGRFYAGEDKFSETQLVSLAIEKLGLSQLGAFDPRKKIIEYRLDNK
jgi:glutamate formiminotransferase/formiminotetrahydrofolate cyclodeaminase